MALVRPGWATAVPSAFQGGALLHGGDWYESAVLPAFPRLGWNRDMPRSFRRMSRYTGVYGDLGNFYGNTCCPRGRGSPRSLPGAAAPVACGRTRVSYG